MIALEARAEMAALEARDLAYMRDGQQILSRVSVSVHPGERLAVTGPSGSGKTSLLTLLAGLDTPSSGEVYIDGVRLTGVAGPGQGVALVLQGYGLVSLLTAAENIEVGLRAAGRAPSEAAAAAREALGQVGLAAHADHLVEELSGGQQQRTAVARALALRPRLLIADEPTAELDPASRALTLTRLFEVATGGGALVLATHDPEVAARCDQVIARVRATHGDALAFAHGQVLRILAARWTGQEPQFAAHLRLSPATISIHSSEHEVPALERWNAPAD